MTKKVQEAIQLLGQATAKLESIDPTEGVLSFIDVEDISTALADIINALEQGEEDWENAEPEEE